MYFRSCGVISVFWKGRCKGPSAKNAQLASLCYSFAVDTSTNLMSTYMPYLCCSGTMTSSKPFIGPWRSVSACIAGWLVIATSIASRNNSTTCWPIFRTVMALPIRLTWSLKMARGKKIGILLLFASGVICILSACLRVVQVAINSTKPRAAGQPLIPHGLLSGEWSSAL
jgi:hypothetical protein